MNQFFRYLSLLLIFTFVVSINSAEAQRRKKKKKTDETEEYFDDKGSFKQRLWYGGDFTFALQSGSFGGSQMTLGISPMVGYKFNKFFSMGPRLSFNYTEFFLEGINPRYLIWGVGAFARAKVTDSFFGHVEYQYQKISELNSVTRDFETQPNNLFLGAGYHSSAGIFGYEMLVLYNVLEESQTNLPIQFRIGFTWNF